MKVLITGSGGLIGSEAVEFFDGLGFQVFGVDNNMRANYFGAEGDTSWNRQRLEGKCRRYTHFSVDIRDREGVESVVSRARPDVVVHAAAQPSHDLAAERPFDDFDVNAGGTLNLLEAVRRHAPEATFAYLSTNKVYGDRPNRLQLVELDRRYDYADPERRSGISEDMGLDDTTHSLYGVSKCAADLLVQEYGRYDTIGLNTVVFRGGCLTGPQHAGTQLHGFLNYLVRSALFRASYTIFGYKGKQVRDQIHCHDVLAAIWAFAQRPRAGAVYNIGGGRENSASILECMDLISDASGGSRPKITLADTPRIGDHICYYTDMTKFKSDYPSWAKEYSLERIVEEMVFSLNTEICA